DGSIQSYIVTVTVAAPSTTKAITAFSFASPAVGGVINEAAHTIAVTVPSGTNVTALVPTITHTGASINPASGVAQNFTNPLTYTVTAADGSTQAYTVTVTVAPASSTKAITAFSFASPIANSVINETAHTIAVTVPSGTNVTALVPTITHTGASINPASGMAQNFTSPVTYTVTAADGTTQPYTVTVTVAAPSKKTLTVNRTGNGMVTSDLAGINCGMTCTFDFDDNTSVGLTAAATSPSTFEGWGGACAAAGTASTCDIIMNQAQTVTATFVDPSSQPLYQRLLGKTLSDSVVSDFILQNGCQLSGFHYLCKAVGIELSLDSGQKVRTVFMYAQDVDGFQQFTGDLPYGLIWTDTRSTAEGKLNMQVISDIPDNAVARRSVQYQTNDGDKLFITYDLNGTRMLIIQVQR
ncbi:MAG TPA: DUF5018 domain-containing protein, partial [Anaerolineales bacterium]|nr:DUF5018 domain-containing protein [Anaerolineales bacterium]